QLRLAAGVVPIGQIVGIAVGVVDKAALLGDEAARIRAAAALIPAQGARAGDAGVYFNRFGDVVAFDRLGDILVVDPAIAVRRDLPIGGQHRGDRRRVALERHRNGIDGYRNAARQEGAMQPPEAGAAAVFVQPLHVYV